MATSLGNYGSLAKSFATITVNDAEIVGVATNINWQLIGSVSDIALGVGATATSSVLYQSPYSYEISFDTFDISSVDNTDVNFDLSQLNADGTSQVIINTNRPQVNGTQRAFDGGTIIFLGVGGGNEAGTVSANSPIIHNFTLKALNKVIY